MMHLERPHLTTTRYHNKTKPNAKQLKAQQAHDAWLRKQGVHPEQLAAKKAAAKKIKIAAESQYVYEDRRTVPVSNTVGNGFKKEEKRYTGDVIIGLGQCHKSNLVPIINKQQAEDIAKMRRG